MFGTGPLRKIVDSLVPRSTVFQGGIALYKISQRKASTAAPYQCLLVEVRGERQNVGFVKLHRPRQHNAISRQVGRELYRAFTEFEENDAIGAVVYTGGEKIFTVGADITEMKDFSFPGIYWDSFGDSWNKIHDFRKPVIAAVNGYCVGGGTETAMMCDIIYAGERAQFGQPEIKIGTLPGAGGTQRLTRAIGKSRSMERILTGEMFTAKEAEAWGLVSKVLPPADVIPEAVKLAELIASKPRIAVLMAKEAVKAADENSLNYGLHLEKMMALTLPATRDFKEGMRAFIEKRPPNFSD